MATFTLETNYRITMAKAALNKKKTFFHQQNGFKLKEETSKLLHLENSRVWHWNLYP